MGAAGLTREFKQALAARLQCDRAFRKLILVEGVQVLLDGDIESAKAILRDYISATGGFERLGREAALSPKSLMRMFSKTGDPTMVDLAKVLLCLQARDNVRLRVRAMRRL